MENVCPERTEDQYVKSPSGEALGRNVHMRRSERIINSPQRYNPGFGAAREWKNDDVASIFYMIHYGDYYIIFDKDNIISLLDKIK